MRHLKRGRKFGRTRDKRRALLKSLASSFFLLGRIRTTEARAKELRPYVEKMLTRAKNPTVANRRLLAGFFAPKVVQKIIEHAALFAARPGGYTRIIKFPSRKSDGAGMAIIELLK